MGLRLDDLPRHTVNRRKTGAQNFMTADDGIQRTLQHRNIKRATELHRQGNI